MAAEADAVEVISRMAPESRISPAIYAKIVELFDGTHPKHSIQFKQKPEETRFFVRPLGNQCMSVLSKSLHEAILNHHILSEDPTHRVTHLHNTPCCRDEVQLSEYFDTLNADIREEMLVVFWKDIPKFPESMEYLLSKLSFNNWLTGFRIFFHPNMRAIQVPDFREVIANYLYRLMESEYHLFQRYPNAYEHSYRYMERMQDLDHLNAREASFLDGMVAHISRFRSYNMTIGTFKMTQSVIWNLIKVTPVAAKLPRQLFERLTVLDFGEFCDNDVLGTIASACKVLISLTFGGSRISDEGIERLCGKVDFMGKPVNDPAIKMTLQYLDFEKAVRINEGAIRKVLVGFKHLKLFKCPWNAMMKAVLTIAWLSKTNNTGPNEFPEVFPFHTFRMNLQSSVDNVTPPLRDFDIISQSDYDEHRERIYRYPDVMAKLANVTVLGFSYLLGNDPTFKDMLTFMGPQLKEIELRNEVDRFCQRMHPIQGWDHEHSEHCINLAFVIKCAPNLTSLSMNMCHVIWNSTEYMPPHLNLQLINSLETDIESNHAFRELLKHCPRVKELSITCQTHETRGRIRTLAPMVDSHWINTILNSGGLKHIEKLIFDNNSGERGGTQLDISADTFRRLLANCPKIRLIGNVCSWNADRNVLKSIANEFQLIEQKRYHNLQLRFPHECFLLCSYTDQLGH